MKNNKNILQLLSEKRMRKWLLATLVLALLLVATVIYYGIKIYAPNVKIGNHDEQFIRIPSGATQSDVLYLLEQKKCIQNIGNLKWVMNKKHYKGKVHSGQFRLKDGMNNNQLVNMLRAGIQYPVTLTFNNTRTIEDFAGKIAKQIELDSITLLNTFRNKKQINALGFTPETIIAMFIPNTYEVYWNISVDAFLKRMYREYGKFWTSQRKSQAKQIGLTPIEVATLASIIDEETSKNIEKPRLAGVYINRLNRNIKLDACPTLKFALGDFSIKRVLNKYKKIDSPYNTYKYAGLPPGPIRQPSISGLKAVLNYEHHNYYYFCAKADFSGFHNFARTLRQHNKNARAYHQALNRKRIWR